MVERIKAAIRDSGQSLQQLGRACGVDAGRLSRFVRGERNLSLEAAEKVCDALGLRLTGADEPLQEQPKRKGKRK